MIVPAWLWIATVVGLCAVIVVDLIVVDRRPREFTSKDAARWVIFYVVLATLFAVFLFFWAGGTYAGQFVAGYLTEYSLSVDNLFVFMVLMASFQVPKELQHRVLLVGVVIALILRAALIVIGAEALHRFAVTFFLFSGFLIFTAWKVWRSHDATPDPDGNALVRWISRHVPMTRNYHGTHLMIKIEGQRTYTPMVLVILVYLVILVTMVYGPIAAMLVEMFPTRIRYTSMSLPYHIGNGWFGGLLPTTAFAMVAATGDIFYGLWYPVIVAAGTFVIGMLFIKETKDVDIFAND